MNSFTHISLCDKLTIHQTCRRTKTEINRFCASSRAKRSFDFCSDFIGQTYQPSLTIKEYHQFQMITSPNSYYSQCPLYNSKLRTPISESICRRSMSLDLSLMSTLIQPICNCMYSFNPTIVLEANCLHCGILRMYNKHNTRTIRLLPLPTPPENLHNRPTTRN